MSHARDACRKRVVGQRIKVRRSGSKLMRQGPGVVGVRSTHPFYRRTRRGGDKRRGKLGQTLVGEDDAETVLAAGVENSFHVGVGLDELVAFIDVEVGGEAPVLRDILA